MVAVQDYGAIKASRPSAMRQNKLAFVALAALAVVAVAAVVVLSSATPARRTEMVENFPQTDLELLSVMQQMAAQNPPPHQTMSMAAAQAPPTPATQQGLSMKQQYARIMQNLGYFAPWSRQNGWVDRVAIDNIRKANTPQALAMRQAQIQAENEKFAKEFDTPHTSQYTGTHESLANILDPKFQPWANDGPRKAYYSGF